MQGMHDVVKDKRGKDFYRTHTHTHDICLLCPFGFDLQLTKKS